VLGVSGARVLPAGGRYSAPVKRGAGGGRREAGGGKREEGSVACFPPLLWCEIQSPISEAASLASASPVSRNTVQSSFGFAPICL